MDSSKSLPNYMMHFVLTQFESYVGKNGTNAVLNYSGLTRLIDNYPPKDFNPGEPIKTFFKLVAAVMEIYGENGYRALLRNVGKKSFQEMIEKLPWLFGIGELELDGLSPAEKYTLVYKTYVDKVGPMFDARTSVEIYPNRIVDTAPDCIWCIELKATGPICIFTEDLYTALGEWLGVADIKVVETHCRAAGDDVCRFVSTFS